MMTNTEWAARFKQELTGNILPFWMRHTVDCENGGFYGGIDCDMPIDKQAPPASGLNARILWTFSDVPEHLGEKLMTRLEGEYTPPPILGIRPDRKSTRLNSSHLGISYAVFCLKKKN